MELNPEQRAKLPTSKIGQLAYTVNKLTKQQTISFSGISEKTVMLSDREQIESQLERPRVFFETNPGHAVKRAFAHAGFLQTRLYSQADVAWLRPNSALSAEMRPHQTSSVVNGQNCLTNPARLMETLSKSAAARNVRHIFTAQEEFTKYSAQNPGWFADVKSQRLVNSAARDCPNTMLEVLDTQPALLDGRKYQIRAFAVVTAACPLRAYVYQDMLVYLANEEFAVENLSEAAYFPRQGIEHEAVDVDAVGYVKPKEKKIQRIRKLNNNDQQTKAEAVIRATLQAAETTLYQLQNGKQFSLLQFDLDFDQNENCYLKCIKANPSFIYLNEVERDIKIGFLHSALNAIGITIQKETKPVLKKNAVHAGEDEDSEQQQVDPMKLPVMERTAVVPRQQFFDFGIYSLLINELRTGTFKFAKVDMTTLSEYEQLLVKSTVDEIQRSKGLKLLTISPHSSDYSGFIIRRYENELVGAALASIALK